MGGGGQLTERLKAVKVDFIETRGVDGDAAWGGGGKIEKFNKTNKARASRFFSTATYVSLIGFHTGLKKSNIISTVFEDLSRISVF